MGAIDSACHAYKNRKTERTKYMFNEGGHLYVFVVYGHNYCLNITAEKEGNPEAVLIRAVEPIEGLDEIRCNRNIKSKHDKDLTNGPGKLCQSMKIDKSFNGKDLITDESIWLIKGEPGVVVDCSRRINIDYARPEDMNKSWRFTLSESLFSSKR